MKYYPPAKMGSAFLYLTCLVLALSSVGARAADAGIDVDNGSNGWLTNRELVLSLSVLVFGGVVLVMEFLLLRQIKVNRADAICKVFTISLIVVATLFLIAANFAKDIAPALGLFGTIAGYLLGRSDLSMQKATPPEPTPGEPASPATTAGETVPSETNQKS